MLDVASSSATEALVVLSDEVVASAIDNYITLDNDDQSLLMTTTERWPA